MIRATIAETRVFESWQDYQEALKRAIAPLTHEQLQKRTISNLRTPGEVAEHIVFGRAYHLYHTLGADATELTPFISWGDTNDVSHTAEEIVQGLELTWQVITHCLMKGVSIDTVSEQQALIIQTIWGLLDHDLPHAGELSLLLGADGLAGVEI